MNETVQSQDDTTNETRLSSLNGKCVVTGIYGLKNKINGKWYVGYSDNIEKRWDRAYRRKGCRRQQKIYAALKKYGYDAFEKIVLEECSNDRSTWGPLETKWIKYYDSIEHGYNIAEGGIGGATRRGLPCSEETKLKIAKSNTGKTQSPETRLKISLSRNRGLLSNFANKNRYNFTNSETGESFRGFRCEFQSAYPQLHRSGISAIITGKRKHHQN